MRTAFSISGHRDSAGAVRAAVAAEAAGFDDVWLTEDYVERGAFALAGAIAARTSRVRVGIGVVNPWTRHPVLTAMEFATLDELSGGRAVLGLGASNEHWMTGRLGIPFHRPLARTLEALTLTRRLLTGEPVSFHGEFHDVEARLSFTPIRPDPPIVLGVKGPQAIARGGPLADGLLLSILAGPAYVRWVRDQVGPGVELSAYVALAVGDDPAAARDRIRPMVATFLGVHGDHVITRQAGVGPDLAARFREGWRTGAPRTDLVTDALLDEVAAAGTVTDTARAFDRLEAAGLDVAVVRDDPAVDPAETMHQADATMRARGWGSPA
ncbi:LLM class flavin-dependent oxidoreductase [Spirilliplanes yamanashiensis]|uniref:5,10-methylenetetrahydromethanopterin reductase n=1 Tax=Spirilliplanes yamanashiensis TaxID=42233 RepID=A0A8J4DGC5_9ACTN|nr:LLM class flavin-dependent oxidoreductase [Spirilliplanes yamanashiensis]MDP9819894.1 5,10-methylenetetrahydromethanopterin reductase [Spirilliplanes yamanashiensis]GIJ01287.1 5,10-methylenetetrahydromethanopterin reductase [Spirilliplanes yamanashiensis]